MPVYPLTQHQKDMIRSLKDGLESGQIETEWTLVYGDDRIMGMLGLDQEGKLWREVWDGVKYSDFDKFVKCGFFSVRNRDKYGVIVGYYLDEYAIIKAVENDFKLPESEAAGAAISVNLAGASISGSNLNIASTLNNSVQKIQNAPAIGEDVRTRIAELIKELQGEVENLPPEHQEDVETVTQQAERLSDDLSREKPNIKTALITADGLQKAASNLLKVAPAVGAIAARIALAVSSLAN